MLRVSAQDTISGILVNGCILEQSEFPIGDALSRHDFHVDLDAFSRMGHLLVRLGHILLSLLFLRQHAFPLHHPVQTFHTPAVPSFPQSAPQLDDSQIWVSTPHVADQGQFFFCVLIGMGLWAFGLVLQRFHASIPSLPPEVDKRSGTIVFPTGCLHPIPLCVVHQGLQIPHVLCYTLHAGDAPFGFVVAATQL